MSKSVKKWLALGICLMLVLSPLRAQIHWTLVEPGVWKGVVGTPEEHSLLSVSGKMPLKEGFTRLPAVTLPALADEITATLNDGKTYITIPLQRQEQLYGFGLNFKTVHQLSLIHI